MNNIAFITSEARMVRFLLLISIYSLMMIMMMKRTCHSFRLSEGCIIQLICEVVNAFELKCGNLRRSGCGDLFPLQPIYHFAEFTMKIRVDNRIFDCFILTFFLFVICYIVFCFEEACIRSLRWACDACTRALFIQLHSATIQNV